jgi:UDP-N-acetylglucosamine 2-epimerase
MKIVSVVGARPQFIKAAPVTKSIREAGHHEIQVHTGQHYDREMSQVFFEELAMPEPAVNLGIGSGSHACQTGQMMIGIEQVLLREKPDWALVYGDTNSTLAGALAAVKLGIPLAHVESGLRSFNRQMPEEHNRVLTDHCADLLLCPTQTAVKNLAIEGIFKSVELVGDTMFDAVLQFAEAARSRSRILANLKLSPRSFSLVTIHRPYNTDIPGNLDRLMQAIGQLGEPAVFPVHPRTRQHLDTSAIPSNLICIDPVGYLDMLMLEQNARIILTDSGGIQKEAFFFEVPCVTLRPETEWLETVNAGWNVVTGTDTEAIVSAAKNREWPADPPPQVFGAGDAAPRIVAALERAHARRTR